MSDEKRPEHRADAPDYRAIMRGLLTARREASTDAAHVINEAIKSEFLNRSNAYAELIAELIAEYPSQVPQCEGEMQGMHRCFLPPHEGDAHVRVDRNGAVIIAGWALDGHLCGESHNFEYVNENVSCVVPLAVRHRKHIAFDPAGRLLSWDAK